MSANADRLSPLAAEPLADKQRQATTTTCDDAASLESLKVRLFGQAWRRARIARVESVAAFGSAGSDQ